MGQPEIEPVETRCRILSINCRRSTAPADLLIRSHWWSRRAPYMIKFLREVGPSIIAVQECTGRQVIDITNGLGPNWSFWGEPSNRQVIWNGDKWDAVDTRAQVIKSMTQQEVTHVRLQSRETGAKLWVTSAHLTQGSANGKWRHLEIREIIKYVKTLTASGFGVIAGDFNSSAEDAGVRKIAAELGYKSLRAKTTNDEISNEGYSSFNGWRKTPTDRSWIDDVLSPSAVEPYGGGVRLTCLRVYPVCASDHNGLLAKVKFTAPSEPVV